MFGLVKAKMQIVNGRANALQLTFYDLFSSYDLHLASSAGGRSCEVFEQIRFALLLALRTRWFYFLLVQRPE